MLLLKRLGDGDEGVKGRIVVEEGNLARELGKRGKGEDFFFFSYYFFSFLFFFFSIF